MNENPLNVAMISYHTCPLALLGGKDTGGMNVYVRELTQNLGRLGVHVDVFTRSQDEHVPHILHDIGYGNRVVHMPAGPEVPRPKQELADYLPEFTAGIMQFGSDKNISYDLIHSHYWLSGIAAKALKQSWNVPIVHMFHTLGHMKNRVARFPHEQEGSYRTQGEYDVLRAADQIIAATYAEQAQLEFLYQANPKKLTIIPPGVDTSHFYPIPEDEAKAAIGMPANDRLLLFVGRIEPLKGVDTLIRALAIIHQQGLLSRYPHYLAIIGGDPEARPEDMESEMLRLKRLCQQLGIGDLVLFLGKQSQSFLPYYYSAAEVVVVPSHYESFGMVALEAMACGTPVVASQVGGLAFLVKDEVTGFVIPDGDPLALAEKLSLLIQNRDLLERMGKQATLYAQDYDWEKITARVVELYKTVLKQNDRTGAVPSLVP